MIIRFFALLLMFYAVGFVLFSVTLGKPADTSVRTDAAVVITGSSGRIEHAMDVLAAGKAKRLLVAGTDPLVTKADLAELLGERGRLIRCCVDLGSESVDTRSNAEEARRWLDQREYRSLRLITSDWHMRRAGYEFNRTLEGDYVIVQDAVRTEPRFGILFSEYNKLVLRRIAAWFDS